MYYICHAVYLTDREELKTGFHKEEGTLKKRRAIRGLY